MEKEKEFESSVEDEKEVEKLQKSEEEGNAEDSGKDEFEEKDEFVSTNKYNQAVRKQREIELEKRRLEKELIEAKKTSSSIKSEEKKEEVEPEKKDEVDSFFDDLGDEEVEKETKVKTEVPDPNRLIDEKLKPVLDSLKKRDEEDRKKVRTAWFEAHPEYLNDSEKWNGVLDVLDKDINPNTSDDYFEQLNKAHILYTGQNVEDAAIVDKKREMASDASSSGEGAQNAVAKEEFTQEDRRYMKEWNISEEGMRAAKEKLKSGAMRIL